jgi:transposase-like protein
MHQILASITSLEAHAAALESGCEAYRPSNCPHCNGCKLWGHGYYERKADRGPGADGALNPVAIARFLCAACIHTCSRVPLCIAPRRWYNWAVQQLVLLLILTGSSVNYCSGLVALDRRTVRRWRDWLAQRSEVFVFRLRSRFAELGREIDTPAMWCSVMNGMTLGVAMAWLDQDLIVP